MPVAVYTHHPDQQKNESTQKKQSEYLPSLDGWRAVAILAVIFHHDSIHSIGQFNTK